MFSACKHTAHMFITTVRARMSVEQKLNKLFLPVELQQHSLASPPCTCTCTRTEPHVAAESLLDPRDYERG